MMATYHSLGIAGKVAGKFIQHPVDLQTALVEIMCGTLPASPVGLQTDSSGYLRLRGRFPGRLLQILL